jgi:hypothetical protein
LNAARRAFRLQRPASVAVQNEGGLSIRRDSDGRRLPTIFVLSTRAHKEKLSLFTHTPTRLRILGNLAVADRRPSAAPKPSDFPTQERIALSTADSTGSANCSGHSCGSRRHLTKTEHMPDEVIWQSTIGAKPALMMIALWRRWSA